jgi:hypothetical protein
MSIKHPKLELTAIPDDILYLGHREDIVESRDGRIQALRWKVD